MLLCVVLQCPIVQRDGLVTSTYPIVISSSLNCYHTPMLGLLVKGEVQH